MKQLVILLIAVGFFTACNQKQGTNEPSTDSKFNPAELPVDSVGASTDMTDRASTDSGKRGSDGKYPVDIGKSDQQVGGENPTGKAVGSDGNIVRDSTKK